jgi:cysteine desulfurase/selenocysteine lyase
MPSGSEPLDYLGRIGIENVTRYERELLAHATQALLTVPGLHLIGTAAHHCAQPIVRHYGHESTIRASLAVYNTCEEIDALITALRSIVERGVQL